MTIAIVNNPKVNEDLDYEILVETEGGSCLVASFLGNAEQKIVLILLHGIISSSCTAFPFVFFQS